MSNTLHPGSAVLGLVNEAFGRFDHETTPIITRSLGDLERCVVGYSKRTVTFW